VVLGENGIHIEDANLTIRVSGRGGSESGGGDHCGREKKFEHWILCYVLCVFKKQTSA
jgi:hypothetical protein